MRLNLLQSGLRCISEYGFEGLTLEKVGKIAKSNKGLLIHYFSSKEKFLDELLIYVGFVGRSHTIQFIEENEAKLTDPVERYIRATLDLARKLPDMNSFLILAIQRATYDTRFRKWINTTFGIAYERIQNFLESHYGVPSDRSAQIAKQIHSMLLGHMLAREVMDVTEDFEQLCVSAGYELLKQFHPGHPK